MESIKNNDLKIGLVGAGYWGKNLVRVFDKLGVLDVICDIDQKILQKIQQDYSNVRVTQNFREILRDKEIKAVVVSTPAATHYQLTKQALVAGKNVFVEKPLALKIEEGDELVEIAEEKNLILMVGHLLLYHPAIVKLKELIEKGELGEIRYICSNRLNFGKLRREENVLWSFAPHDISVIIDLLGMPEKIQAIGKSYLQQDIPDITLTFLGFENNKAAHIFVSWLHPFKEQKLSVIGSKKMAVFDGVENKLMIFPHRIQWQRNNLPQAVKAKGELVSVPKKEPLFEEAKHFLECVKEHKTPKTDGKEALAVLKILAASQESLERMQDNQTHLL